MEPQVLLKRGLGVRDLCQGVEFLRVDEMALVVNGEGNGAWEAQIFKGQAEEVVTEKV